MPVVSIIMAGGVGERFWPYSRKSHPKQLLTLFGNKPMIRQTVDRLKPITPPARIYISTGKDLAAQIKRAVKGVKYVLEPVGRNTAACIGLSAIQVMRDHGDAMMFIETADHVYEDSKAYIAHVKEGIKAAEDDRIVMIGIKPTEPHTGYGYIRRGKPITRGKIPAYEVISFKEKPNLKTAKRYLRNDMYYWNSGMFIAKASVMLDEIRKHMPKLHRALESIRKSRFNTTVLRREFEKLDSVSIDYGVIEKSRRVAVIGAALEWDDIGDWSALSRHFKKDKNGNVVIGEHTGLDTHDSIIVTNNRLIATQGVKNLIIIDTKDGLLVIDKSEASNLKKLVMKINKKYTN